MADHRGLSLSSPRNKIVVSRCELDSKGCVSLKCILDAFNTPLSEEQAWAVCYETVKRVLRELDSKDNGQPLYEIDDLCHIRIHKDGSVYPSSVRDVEAGKVPRKVALSEYKIINSLGLVVFNALDYSLETDDEPSMSPALESLLDDMTSAGPNDKYSSSGRSGSKSSRSSRVRRDHGGRNSRERSGVSRESDGRERRRRRRTSGGLADDDVTSSSSSSSEEEEELSRDEDSDHPDDEGIERDHEDVEEEQPSRLRETEKTRLPPHGVVRARKGLTLEKILRKCCDHIPSPTQPDAHYKAVCRALVAEVLELSSFLQKIAVGTKELRKTDSSIAEKDNMLDNLHVHDWARLWVQVIRELRQGVKLKKVNLDDHDLSHQFEFELTPFEMLLDDIRSRRYNLRKIMVNGDLPPRVKKDAHALILEFIRSRPPLVPVSKRVLPPPPVRPPTLYEKLMTSIRQQHKLKPTQIVESSRTSDETAKKCEPQPPQRRLIKADLELRLSTSFDDDDDDFDTTTPTSDQPMSLPIFSTTYDKRKESPSSLAHERRRSISSIGTPDNKSVSSRKSSGSQQSPGNVYSENYWSCSHWRSLECLSLTLEEVVHIRNVLTKAELESVVGDRELYDDLVRGKICFTCKKIRFTLFGPWRHRCKLCERAVCVKCATKMKVPTEHFAKIPVYMLSPTPSPPFEKEPTSLPFWKFNDNVDYSDEMELNMEDVEPKASCNSKTPSMKTSSSDEDIDAQQQIPNGDVNSRTSPPGSGNDSFNNKRDWKLRHAESFNFSGRFRSATAKKTALMRSNTVREKSSTSPRSPVYDILDEVNGGQKFSGPLVAVCRDCKALVNHIMETGRNPSINAVDKNNKGKGGAGCVAPFCLASVNENPDQQEIARPWSIQKYTNVKKKFGNILSFGSFKRYKRKGTF